tara:strand:- start:807 stop:917 length:111 start_codon:yes stop_codon:yes gene_type:complete
MTPSRFWRSFAALDQKFTSGAAKYSARDAQISAVDG